VVECFGGDDYVVIVVFIVVGCDYVVFIVLFDVLYLGVEYYG